MRVSRGPIRSLARTATGCAVLAALAGGVLATRAARAAFPWSGWWHKHHHAAPAEVCPPRVVGQGAWYWVRSPEEERQVVMSLYNRYCLRCHGVDGRGVWDIPGVPDFSNGHWQSFHPDDGLARSILEGRGAVMPPFRGTLTIEEAWAMARYLRTFVPGTETPRTDREPAPASAPTPTPRPTPAPAPAAETSLPPLPRSARGAFAR